MNTRVYVLVAVTAGVLLSIGGCPPDPTDNDNSGRPTPTGISPVANAGVDRTVNPGDVVTLDSTASNDPRNRPITRLWEQIAGPTVALSNVNDARPTFTAPSVAELTALEFRLTVTNPDQRSATDTVTISVNPGQAPSGLLAEAGDDQVVDGGATVQLSGAGSRNESGGTLTYRWKQIAGPVMSLRHVRNPEGVPDPLNGKPDPAKQVDPYFVAPEVTSETVVTFQLTVSVAGGASAVDTVSITIRATTAPIARAGADQTVNENTLVNLDGSASTGSGLTFAWTKTAGPTINLNNANTAQPTFMAPLVNEDTVVRLKLTVTDSRSRTAEDEVAITVRNTSPQLISRAGPDQTVNERTVVTLDGSASVGDRITYRWQQTAGPAVTLSSATAVRPTFTAPDVNANTAINMQLTVTDFGGETATDTVTINVTNINRPPTANAGVDQTVQEGFTVTLDSTGSSDPDNDVLARTWVQTAGPTVVLSSTTAESPRFLAPAVTADPVVLTFEVTVRDPSNATAKDSVTITVNDSNTIPRITAEPPVLDLFYVQGGAVPNPQIGISNAEFGRLVYTIAAQTNGGGNWLTPATLQGVSDGEVDNILLTISAGLAAGTYGGTLTISDPDAVNSPQTITVNLTVLPAGDVRRIIDVNRRSLTVPTNGSRGADPASVTFTIRNVNSPTMNYTIGSDQPWMTVNPPTGSVGQTAQTITVSFPGAGSLAPAVHTGNITITAANAVNSPLVIPVRLPLQVEYGSELDISGTVQEPGRPAVDAAGNIYIPDITGDRVRKFSPGGVLLQTFGSGSGTGNGQLDGPVAVAIDPDGNVLVVEVNNHRVSVFAPNGLFVRKFGSKGAQKGQMEQPFDIALDSARNVYVAEFKNQRVQKFSPSGTSIRFWAVFNALGDVANCSGLTVDSLDRLLVVAGDLLAEYDTDGFLQRNLRFQPNLRDVVVDGLGNVYLITRSETPNDEYGFVTQYSPAGAYLSSWSLTGSGVGQAGDEGMVGFTIAPDGTFIGVTKVPIRAILWSPP